jgi:biotin synthase
MVEATKTKESPEYVRLSLSSAMALGLKPGIFHRNAKVPCINLLLTYEQGCSANCAFCGLARERGGRYVQKSFIRVEWPTHSVEEIIDRIGENLEGPEVSRVRRICISMITIGRARRDTVTVARRLTERLDLPVSALVSPTIMTVEDFVALRDAGVDRIGIAVDCATEEIFDRIRGRGARGPHRWDHYWKSIETAMQIFGPDRVGMHFIVGLAETERQMVEAIQKVRDMGGSTHLFSFFPEQKSRLADWPQPPIGQYRRIQLARYLIDEDIATIRDLVFGDDGGISEFRIPRAKLDEVIDSGYPFETSGCPGRDGRTACNRPYANCIPGPEIRNYPFTPFPKDVERIRQQLWT